MISVQKLLEEMLVKSDDTAANIFFDKLTQEERDDVYEHIGVINPEAPSEKQSANRPLFFDLTPRNLATIFRALYNATYLNRDSSNYLLNILTQTEFNKDVVPDVSPDEKIAHKVGVFLDGTNTTNEYHDCGIAFIPNHPYLYCLMSKDFQESEAKKIIRGMNDIVYNYFKKNSSKN
jgi:beta-lactamase class A